MSSPAVSVLMPCYNAAATLDEAMQSLVCQTLTDFEIVAVDDGSDDATPQILRQWAQRDPRVRMITLPHGGIVKALNAGLAECRAPLVARMDADDWSHPERLALQSAYLHAHPQTDVLGCRVSGLPQGSLRTGFRLYLDWLNQLLSDEQIRREIFIESPLPHPSVIFRRERILRLEGYRDQDWPEDYDLWLRLYLDGAHFARLPQTLLAWRDSPGRLTRLDSRYSVKNFLRLKASYLSRGPLQDRDAVLLWGAGMMGRRLGRHLRKEGLPLVAYFDLDPRKIGNTRNALPILPPGDLLPAWAGFQHPALLVAVGARGARPILRERMAGYQLVEGQDWWFTA